MYIDSMSVTDGKHWLAIIEGIQDYECLRMLRDRVAELVAIGLRGWPRVSFPARTEPFSAACV